MSYLKWVCVCVIRAQTVIATNKSRGGRNGFSKEGKQPREVLRHNYVISGDSPYCQGDIYSFLIAHTPSLCISPHLHKIIRNEKKI